MWLCTNFLPIGCVELFSKKEGKESTTVLCGVSLFDYLNSLQLGFIRFPVRSIFGVGEERDNQCMRGGAGRGSAQPERCSRDELEFRNLRKPLSRSQLVDDWTTANIMIDRRLLV